MIDTKKILVQQVLDDIFVALQENDIEVLEQEDNPEEQVKEAYRIIQSARGKKSAQTGMSMSERGKIGARIKKEKRAKIDKNK